MLHQSVLTYLTAKAPTHLVFRMAKLLERLQHTQLLLSHSREGHGLAQHCAFFLLPAMICNRRHRNSVSITLLPAVLTRLLFVERISTHNRPILEIGNLVVLLPCLCIFLFQWTVCNQEPVTRDSMGK